MKIPKIIHQIWSGVDESLPSHFKELGDTWKEDYPSWEYRLWDNAMMNVFVQTHYPQYWSVYEKYPYNVQRWDAIRYLILDKIGGMYVDFDYESLKPIDDLIKDKTCCFALEPQSHCQAFWKQVDEVFNNAMMLCVPEHPFMKQIIEVVLSEEMLDYKASKDICVLHTTGPWRLIDLYYNLSEESKKDVFLIPAKYVTPFDLPQAHKLRWGEESEELEECLEEAYAVHYFFSNWRIGTS